jgi:hypothetical protein
MSDISQITLPDGNTYDLADTTARYGTIIKCFITHKAGETTDIYDCDKSFGQLSTELQKGRIVVAILEASGVLTTELYYAVLYNSSYIYFTQLVNPTVVSVKYLVYHNSNGIVYRYSGYAKTTASYVNLSSAVSGQTITQQTVDTAIMKGKTYTILAASWSSETTTINDVEYYTYVLSSLQVEKTQPIIAIAPATGNTLPTEEEQNAFNTWEYATVESTSTYNRKNIVLYSRIVPTSDFTIHITGVY